MLVIIVCEGTMKDSCSLKLKVAYIAIEVYGVPSLLDKCHKDTQNSLRQLKLKLLLFINCTGFKPIQGNQTLGETSWCKENNAFEGPFLFRYFAIGHLDDCLHLILL